MDRVSGRSGKGAHRTYFWKLRFPEPARYTKSGILRERPPTGGAEVIRKPGQLPLAFLAKDGADLATRDTNWWKDEVQSLVYGMAYLLTPGMAAMSTFAAARQPWRPYPLRESSAPLRIIWNPAGPNSTMNIAGKIKNTRGNSILIGAC